MSFYAKARIVNTPAQLDAIIVEPLRAIPAKHYPLRIEVKREHPRRRESKNRLLNAHIRDIARWRYGVDTVPEKLFEKIVADTKALQVDGKHIWPRYNDPEPDTYTGEVVYGPVSRGELTDKQINGIMDWLVQFIAANNIPVKVEDDGEWH